MNISRKQHRTGSCESRLCKMYIKCMEQYRNESITNFKVTIQEVAQYLILEIKGAKDSRASENRNNFWEMRVSFDWFNGLQGNELHMISNLKL